jgi:hypothetical protein
MECYICDKSNNENDNKIISKCCCQKFMCHEKCFDDIIDCKRQCFLCGTKMENKFEISLVFYSDSYFRDKIKKLKNILKKIKPVTSLFGREIKVYLPRYGDLGYYEHLKLEYNDLVKEINDTMKDKYPTIYERVSLYSFSNI